MNNWQAEFTAEYNRQRILEEVEQIRLEKLALQSRKEGPSVFAPILIGFGSWLIAAGKQLRQRSEMPAAHRATHSQRTS